MSGRALGKPRYAGDRGDLETCTGNLRSKGELIKCGARGRQNAEQGLVRAKNCGANKSSFLFRAYSSSRLESRGASLRGEASSARNPKPSSMCQRARRPTGGPCCLTVVVVAAGGGRGPTPPRCHPRKTGRDPMGSYATLQTFGEIGAKTAK